MTKLKFSILEAEAPTAVNAEDCSKKCAKVLEKLCNHSMPKSVYRWRKNPTIDRKRRYRNSERNSYTPKESYVKLEVVARNANGS